MKKKRDVSLIILYDSEGRILLQHRTDDAPISPGMWGFFGGGLNDGESFEEAVKREALEELNYEFRDLNEIFRHGYVSCERNGVKCYFAEECLNKSSIMLGEGQDMKWVTFEEAKMLNIKESNLNVLKQIFDILGNK